jgi:hypothetical protein
MKRVAQWIAAAVVLGVAAPTYGDCGSIPYRSPIDLWGQLVNETTSRGGKNIRFDPMKVVVYEPGQKGIILWNGQEEILLLSTDLRSSEPVSVLEVIPMPAEPTVRLGDFNTFERMQKLLIEKSMWRVASGGGIAGVEPPSWAAKITFHEKMGVHDISVVNVLHKEAFVEWVTEFLATKQVDAEIDPAFLKVIVNYLDRGFQWFVFDSLQLDNSVHSRQPVEYRFKTDNVFYPLEISTREMGKTNVELVLVTAQELKQFPQLRYAVKKDKGVTITQRDLTTVDAGWAEFLPVPQLNVQRVVIKGNIRKMTTDFIAR